MKKINYPLLQLLILIVIFTGCGKKIEHNSQDSRLAKANAYINHKKFEKAVDVLEKLHQEDPYNKNIQSKLMHAMAGAGGFESLKLLKVGKEIEKLIKEFTERLERQMIYDRRVVVREIEPEDSSGNTLMKSEHINSRNNKRKTEEDTESSQSLDIIKGVEKLLEPVPNLNKRQLEYLDQAISLYQKFDIEVLNTSEYSNFKWATLHVFRMAVNIKKLVTNFQIVCPQGDSCDLFKFQILIIPGFSSFGLDLFMSYKLYEHSFDRIKDYPKAIDKIIAYLIKDKKFKLQVNTKAKNINEFYSSLIKDNSQGVNRFIKKSLDLYVHNEQTQETSKKVQALFQLFLENILKKNTDMESDLKDIFTDELKGKALESINLVLKKKSFDPVSELLKSKGHEMDVLTTYYKVVLGELSESEIPEQIRIDVEKLKTTLINIKGRP